MIKLAEAEYIRHLWEVEGKSLREISRVTNLNFRTVQKYTIKTDWNETAKPKKVSYYPVLGDYIETINDWLQADEREPRKQRHTIRQIHKRLVKEKGFTGSYSSVKKYIRKKRLREGKTLDGSLPLSHNKGHAQIDFGELKYYDSQGNGQKGHYLTICFPYSNAGFVQVFKSENQECLLEGMKSIFTYVGGVPKVIKADNMTTAVTKILPQGKRELAEGFRRFMLHYRFQGEFCNPAKGNEKGSVENKVGYTRRNFFVPVPTITDFESYNKELLQICEQDMEREHYLHGVTIKELWHEEQRELLSLPENEYRVFRYETVRINNYGFVTIDNNKYGVTPELAGEQAEVKIYFNRIEIYFEHTLLKTYERCYGQNQEISDWTQYLSLLAKKPGGLTHMRYFDQIPKLWREYLADKEGKERKSAIMLLSEIVQDNMLETGSQALELAALYGRNDTESIKQCYFSLCNNEYNPEPVSFSFQTPVANYNPELDVYDTLTERIGSL